jgi:hypothetical protein
VEPPETTRVALIDGRADAEGFERVREGEQVLIAAGLLGSKLCVICTCSSHGSRTKKTKARSGRRR